MILICSIENNCIGIVTNTLKQKLKNKKGSINNPIRESKIPIKSTFCGGKPCQCGCCK